MGTDWRAYTVIGCEVTGKLYREVAVPGCAHIAALPPSAEIPQYCPQCGQKAAKVQQKPIDGYEDGDDKLRSAGGTCGLVFSTGDRDRRRAFAGIVTLADYYKGDGIVRQPPMIETGHVRAVLEPIGLWDAATFSIWTLLVAS